MGLENFCLDLETLLPYMSRQVWFLEMLNWAKRTQQIDLLSNVWFFIAQLIEHYRVSAEAMDSNPLEAFYFFGGGGEGDGLSCNRL